MNPRRNVGRLGWASPAIFFLSLLSAAPTLAQSGGLEVLVFETAAQQPVAGATVTLTSDRGFVAPTSLTTDADGIASFPVLHPGGGYSIEVELAGGGRRRVEDVRVRGGAVQRVVVRVDESLTETLHVTARASPVDLDRGGTASRFSDEFVDELPVSSRFYQNMLSLAPGVNDADQDGNPNVHGARTRDFQTAVNGVSNVDPLTGQWLGFVNPDTIEDVEIVTTGAGAEYGRAQGGFARIVQKQGSNEFEGLFDVIYRSKRFDGNGATNTPNRLTPEFSWTQPSVQVSGPIVRDRLWYRLSHEWIHGADPVNLFDRVVRTPRDQAIHADQLTWQASPRNKIALQYQSDPLTLGNLGLDSSVADESGYSLERGGDTWSLTWTAPYSARLLADSTVAWQDTYQNVLPSGRANNNCAFFIRYNGLQYSRCLDTDKTLISGTFPDTSRDARQRMTVRGQLTWFVPAGGSGRGHQVKLGMIVENERYARELRRTPDMTFRAEKQRFDPCPFGGTEPCYQRVGLVSARIPVPESSRARSTGVSWGMWLEDRFRPLPTLSITAGIRVDREEIDAIGNRPFDPAAEAAQYRALRAVSAPPSAAAQMSFTGYPDIQGFQEELARILHVPTTYVQLGAATTQSSLWFKSLDAGDIRIENTRLSPRLSLAWDPFGDGRTKLSLSAGRYYDKIFLAVPLIESEPIATNLFLRGTYDSQYFQTYLIRDRLDGVNPTVSTQFVDRGLSAPYQDEYTIGFERELWRESTARVTWIRRHYRDQLQDVDVNHAPDDLGRCILAGALGLPTVASSVGAGETIIDPYTLEEYVDTDPGPGDGRVDDCSGNVVAIAGNEEILNVPRPDGLDDLYVLNPGWGEILLVGNFNRAEYEAWVVEFTRRRFRGVELQASYTWSKATGDAEDFDQLLGNERNLLEDERGYLSYDQRHVVRVNGAASLPLGLRAGFTVRWESGLPWSIVRTKDTLFSIPPLYLNIGDLDAKFRQRYPTGQRNDHRNPSFWTVDLLLAREMRLWHRLDVRVSAEIFNLLDDDTLRLTEQIDGVNVGAQRFGRQFQFGLRVAF